MTSPGDLGLTPFGRVLIRGEAGTVPARKARLPPMKIGGHTVDNVVCHVRDLAKTSSIKDPPEIGVAGVLGMDVFREFQLHIDPGGPSLTFAAPHATTENGDVVRLKALGRRRVQVALEVEDTRMWALVDTGAGKTYLQGARAGLQPTATNDVTIRGTGKQGAAQARVDVYEVPAVALGKQVFSSLAVYDRYRPWWRRGPRNILGLNLLKQVAQTYDFQGRRLHLAPTKPAPIPRWESSEAPRIQLPAQ